MRAVVWHGRRNVSVDTVDDPVIEDPTDAIIRVTSSGLCGSDLHLYEVMGAFMTEGDVLGHEPMGIVEAVGSEVTSLAVGDRVVVPFNIACGHCAMCADGLQSQCETTQVTAYGCGAALLGYTKLYGRVPGAQAELQRVPHADYGPIKVPGGGPDDRYLFLSDVLPTAWQGVEYADVAPGGTLVVLGLGPIGDMCCRIAQHRGIRVLGIDLVDDRLRRQQLRGVPTLDLRAFDDDQQIVEAVCGVLGASGPDAVIDAVGMEAHGSGGAKIAQSMAALLPGPIAERLMRRAGVDRLAALHLAIRLVRRGGTISVLGVYGGMTDPMPMMTMFDKQIQLRMGQANVRRWVDDLMPLVTDGDPLGVDGFATHHLSLEDAPDAYADFQHKRDGMVKAVFNPATPTAAAAGHSASRASAS